MILSYNSWTERVSFRTMKTSGHFDDDVSKRPDRVDIRDEWVKLACDDLEFKEFQENERVRH